MAGPQGMSKEVIYIVIAVICGAFGLYQVNQYVEERLSEYRSQLTDTIQVVQLKDTVTIGKKIDNMMIEMAEVPQAFKIDKRAVRWNDRNKIVDHTVNSTVERGEILMWYAMEMGGAASIKDKIPPGQKAVTIPMTLLTGSAGMLRPNMSVDLYAIVDFVPKDKDKEKNKDKDLEYSQAQLIKENVTIVACDAVTSADKMGNTEEGITYATVTILVEANEVERLLLMSHPSKDGTKALLISVLRSEMDVKGSQASKPYTSLELGNELFLRGQNAMKERLEAEKSAAPQK